MPIQVNRTWQDKIATVVVEFDGDTAQVDYRINRITAATVDRVTQSANDITVLTQELSRLIVRWNIIGDPDAESTAPAVIDDRYPPPDGMYPLDPTSLSLLPLALLSTVTEAVFGSIAPKSTKISKR
jgi:hypothetical protein